MRCMCGSGMCDRCREERLFDENRSGGLVSVTGSGGRGPHVLAPLLETVRYKYGLYVCIGFHRNPFFARTLNYLFFMFFSLATTAFFQF